MTDAFPERDVWLRELVEHSPLIAETALRQHWQRVIPRLPISARYELAAILLEVEHSLG
jgi:hypothetical protein